MIQNYLRDLNRLPYAARYQRLKADWDSAIDAALRLDASPKVKNLGNTFSSQLTTAYLLNGFITKLQNRLGPLMAFTREFSQDPYKPLATGVLKYVNATTAAQTDVTNFEAGEGDTIAAVQVTMHQYTKNFGISNAELMAGARMENLMEINSAGMGDKIISVATAPITTAGFPGTPLTSAPSAFGLDDMTVLWAQLKKSPVKNVILDGDYIARIINQPTLFQKTGVNDPGGWKSFGWDGIYCSTNWTGTGAGENIRGFACNPQAIIVVSGIPLTPPVSDQVLTRTVFVLPGVELPIVLHTWFSLASRTAWGSLDLMMGASLVDSTAGIIIKSA